MFASPPALEPPPITAEQQADLDCVRVGTTLGKSGGGGVGISPWAPRLVRIYLPRLQRSDPSRDWLSLARSSSDPSYGWFLQTLDRCAAPLRPRQRVRLPEQASPPAAQPPSQPTGR